jgi:hypothetical protein
VPRRPARPRNALPALAALVAALLLAAPATAGPLPTPEGRVLLVVKGSIANTNVDREAHFDRQSLESLGVTQLSARTPWHREGAVFSGVPARALMQGVGATGTTAVAKAANDYKVSIPLTDFSAYDVLLATHIDGEALTLRTRGPIWLIYPADADLPEPVRQERMIWQLTEFRIE